MQCDETVIESQNSRGWKGPLWCSGTELRIMS